MKIAVLGAAGAMAQVVLRDLLEFLPEAMITAADARPVEAGDPRVQPALLDARDIEGTARLLAGHDAVLNCVTYYFNNEVMRAALEARVPYADLGGLYHGTSKQFALDEEFRAAGVPALLGMGSTPGITNVMAGAMARGLDHVDAIHVRVGCIDTASTGVLPVPYALDTVLDEFCLEPMVLRGGKPVAVPPMSGAETIDFPDPIGRAEALYTLHSEVAMFPRSFPGLSEASFKVAFTEEFTGKMRFLVELGFGTKDAVLGGVSPRAMLLALASRQAAEETAPADCDAIRVDLRGSLDGRIVERRAETVVRPHSRWRVAAGALDTGVPLAIAGAMLARREITTAGVLCPEVAVDPERFFAELARREIHVALD